MSNAKPAPTVSGEPLETIQGEGHVAGVVADIVRKNVKPDVISVGEGHLAAQLLVLPNGFSAHSVKRFTEEQRRTPERREGTAVFQDLESFIAHAKRFADGDSALFASSGGVTSASKITSVLDYHRAGADAATRNGKHRGDYTFPFSDEWRAWAAANGVLMSLNEFASFLEDHIIDIIDPAKAGDASKEFADLTGVSFAGPSKMRDLSRGIQVNSKSVVKNATNLSTGEVSMIFETEHTDAGGHPLKVPGGFLLGIPVFKRGSAYQLAARLRYQMAGGVIKWRYDLYRVDYVFDHAFTEACKLAQEATSLPLFYGSPE